jgi:hypothetical protein
LGSGDVVPTALNPNAPNRDWKGGDDDASDDDKTDAHHKLGISVRPGYASRGQVADAVPEVLQGGTEGAEGLSASLAIRRSSFILRCRVRPGRMVWTRPVRTGCRVLVRRFFRAAVSS